MYHLRYNPLLTGNPNYWDPPPPTGWVCLVELEKQVYETYQIAHWLHLLRYAQECSRDFGARIHKISRHRHLNVVALFIDPFFKKRAEEVTLETDRHIEEDGCLSCYVHTYAVEYTFCAKAWRQLKARDLDNKFIKAFGEVHLNEDGSFESCDYPDELIDTMSSDIWLNEQPARQRQLFETAAD